MARQLTADEATVFRVRLQSWQSPNEFKLVLDELMAVVGHDYLLLGDTDFREAHIAQWCADALKPDSMRLYPDAQGDFEMTVSDQKRLFETTEALLSDRKRNLEIRQDLAHAESEQPQWESVPQERMNWEDQDAENQVVARAEAKAQKDYEFDRTELVVYMNCGWSGHQHERFLKSAYDKMPTACAKFRRVWIYSSNRLVQVSENGSRQSMDWIDDERRAWEALRIHGQTPLDEILSGRD